MCRAQCVLILVSLYVGVVHSWWDLDTKYLHPDPCPRIYIFDDPARTSDNPLQTEATPSLDFAVTIGDQLEFYTNGNKTHSEGLMFRDLKALAYDPINNMLIFVDELSDDASIFSFNISSKKYQSLVKRKAYENIQGLAFDPVSGLLFWTDTYARSIYWISLKPGSKNNVYGNLLIKMEDEVPTAIAVDSCREYIYWTNIKSNKPTIERARFNGSEREIVIDGNINLPISMVVDQRTKRIYWIDDREGIHYSIESADLNGKNRVTLYVGIHHQPNALTVSKDSIYWVDWGFKSVWQLPKDPTIDQEPREISNFKSETPFGIAANYRIEDQTEGSQECEALASLSQNKSVINDSFNIPTDAGLFCVHGTKVSGKLLCKCIPGYTGERCDVSICQNYCFQGDCSFNVEGLPKCGCHAGYSGHRCEVNVCFNYCLNDGNCFVNEKNEPVCQCVGNHEGSRCEADKVTLTNIHIPYSPESNLTLADLVSSWINPAVNLAVNVGV